MLRKFIAAVLVAGFAAVVASSLMASVVHATTVVAPNSLADTESPFDGNSSPFGFTTGSSRYQQVYGSNQFGALTAPEYITHIAFRPDGFDGQAFSATTNAISVFLSTTNASADHLSLTADNNLGVDNTLVHAGPLSLSSSGGPLNFDIIIALSTAFLYDPNAGNLLLDVILPTGSGLSSAITKLDFAWDSTDSVSRYNWVIGANYPVYSVDTGGLVTQFTTVSVVPLPPSAILFGTALLGLGAVSRRRRKRGAA